MKIISNWLKGDDVHKVPTRKKGGYIKPLAIVMHYTAGWTHDSAVYTLAKSSRKASAHVDVGRDGKVTQMIPFNRRGWHAGPSRYKELRGLNGYSVGIEQDNIGPLRYKAKGQWKDGYGNIVLGDGRVLNHRGDERFKLPTGPDEWLKQKHPVHGNADLWWEPYSDELLARSEEIVKLLLKKFPSIKYIVSHEEIDTRGWKSDPGPAFPMRHFKALGDRDFVDRKDNGHDHKPGEPVVYQVQVDGLNAREKADYNSNILDVFPKWRLLNVYGTEGKWSKIKWYKDDVELEGYVATRFLDER